MPTFILRHQLHNQTQISADYVLAQLFVTLMNATTVKWLNQMEHMDEQATIQKLREEDVNKLIKQNFYQH